MKYLVFKLRLITLKKCNCDEITDRKSYGFRYSRTIIVFKQKRILCAISD